VNKTGLLFLLVALNLADIITTIYGISLGGSELNPLFPGESFITRESLIIKICLVIVYAGIFIVSYKLCKKESFIKGLWVLNIQLLVLVGIYIVVVGNNLLGIITSR